MNNTELLYYRRLEKLGWEVASLGWPDFFAIKDGKVRFIELKMGNIKPNKGQQRMHELIKRGLGINVEVVNFQQIIRSKYSTYHEELLSQIPK